MTNKHIGILMALLVALSTGLADAREADESQPPQPWLCSRATISQSWAIESPDQAWSSPTPAAKRLANLNVGPPRTVRLIYFLPNDRSYRAEVVDAMKTTIRRVQTFYAEQMKAHGYGDRTFRLETDAAGRPLVHRVDGRHPDSYYLNYTFSAMYDELEQAFDLSRNNYIIVIDNSVHGVRSNMFNQFVGGVAKYGDKDGNWGLFSEEWLFFEDDGFVTMAHELGHAFGLQHDFRDDAYIMSYGPGEDRLSACTAEFLARHPYFNDDVSTGGGGRPIIEPISLRYPAGSNSASVQLRVGDSDGLHQVTLLVRTRSPHFAAGSLEVKACRGLGGEREAVVEFDYDGVIPSAPFSTSLSMSINHPIEVRTVDRDGNSILRDFALAEISSHHIATLEGFGDPGSRVSVAFSPDGTTLAAGLADGTVKLWNVAAKTNIATLGTPGYGALADEVSSVAFSPDGTTLAAGLANGAVKLWNVAAKTNIATFTMRATRPVYSVAFSPDGKTLAAGAKDGAVELWDVNTKTNTILEMAHNRSSAAFSPAVAFSPDGKTLAAGSLGDDAYATVKLWDMATKTNIATFGPTGPVYSVAFSPDGTTLAAGRRSTVQLWDVATKTNIATFEDRFEVYSVAFSPDGAILATGESTGGRVHLWDVTTKTKVATFAVTASVYSVAFSPNGATLATGVIDATVQLWDVSEWTEPSEPKTTTDDEAIPQTLTKISGDEQGGQAGTALPKPFVVSALDQNGSAFAGAVVRFSVTAGGGTISATTATTDASGQARSTLTLGPEPGTNTVTASVEGLGTVTFTATAIEQISDSQEDPEPDPQLESLSATIDDVTSAAEHGRMTFTVRLEPTPTAPTTVKYATASQTATAGEDYEAATGTLHFEANQNIATFTVRIRRDEQDEPNETFAVRIVHPSTRALLAEATGTITDDDGATPPEADSDGDDEMADGKEDSEMAFAFAKEVEDQAYTAGTTITPLVLPEATGGEGEVTYRVSDLPAGLAFDAATRTISGMPEAATDGAIEVTYTAEDSTGAAVTLAFSITVNPPLSFGALFGLFNGGASEEDAGGG